MKRLEHVRILMYSHDTFGLGHLRRCRAIAHALVERFKGLHILIISGSPIAGAFDFRARVDFVKIPSVIKLHNGEYTSIDQHIDIQETLEMRTSMIRNTVDSFHPEIFIVDKEPLGLRGELEDILRELKSRDCTLVLGLRDVMDLPALLSQEWGERDMLSKIENYYDKIWVYGPEEFWNPLTGLDVSEGLLSRLSYTGFLDRTISQSFSTDEERKPYILVTTGGGGDGASLVRQVLSAYENCSAQISHDAVVVLGPFMLADDREEIFKRASALDRVQIIEFENRIEKLIDGAAALVGMCGYNTFCEILSFDKRALIIPRMRPREEQFVRAVRAAELGLIDVLEPQNAEDPKRMAAALQDVVTRPLPSSVNAQEMMTGLDTIATLVEDLIGNRNRPAFSVIEGGVSPVMADGHVAVILKGYPRLSETFIAEELLGLERAGLALRLYSMRHPTDPAIHPVHREISAPVTYLPEYLHHEPLRVMRGLLKAVGKPGFGAAFRTWCRDLKSDLSRNRFRRFGQAAVLIAELPDDVTHLHAHFMHTPASVAHYASLISGLPWTCSAHAKDIWTSADRDLKGKLSAAQWVVTCTRIGFEHLTSLARDPGKVHLSYHGLDLERFPPRRAPASKRDGAEPADPVRLLTVCRAVEKKGLDTLLEALAGLPPSCHWHLTHIGGGALIDRLKQQARQLKIDDQIDWLGAQPQETVLEKYRSSDLFVLPCRIAPDGDRDGLPNVIVEAQSQALCCLSTNISGVPELIEDGHNGVLVPPDDPAELAAGLVRLIADPAERHRMGERGEARVRRDFSSGVSVSYLKQLFEKAMSPERPVP